MKWEELFKYLKYKIEYLLKRWNVRLWLIWICLDVGVIYILEDWVLFFILNDIENLKSFVVYRDNWCIVINCYWLF